MTPDATLPSQPWMTRPGTRAVVAALRAQGAEVRFVGGCVRDSLAGRPVKDVDLATVDPPDQVIALLEAARIKAVPTGLSHGTVTAVAHHEAFEVTTLRHDVESHGRHATVTFTDDWQADAARRDFTFNALSLSPEGALYDPFGGRADLAAGRVRFVGQAVARIEEDYLRLLRFFRFQAYYGRGALDPEGRAAARALAPHLAQLSGERIHNELLRLLGAADPVPVLEVMAEDRSLAAVLPDLEGPPVLKALLGLGLAEDPLLRLAALLPADPATAERVAKRLRMSRAERARLTGALGQAVALERTALRQALYRLGAETVGDRVRLAWGRHLASGGPGDDRAVQAALAQVAAWPAPRFPLKGRDALALGLEPGDQVGRLLVQVETWWIDQDFGPDRAACLAHLKQLADRS